MNQLCKALTSGDADIRRGIELAIEKLGERASEEDILIYARDAARGMKEERERVRKILTCSPARANWEQAKFIAFQTDLPPDEAIRALEALAAAGGDGRLM